MKFARLFVCVWLVSTGLSINAVHARETVIFGHNGFCPYHCIDSQTKELGQKPGFFVELINLALEDSRFVPEFKLVPLERAREDLENGRLDAWANGAVAFYPEHLFAFPDVDTVSDYGCFYARKDDPWTYATPRSLASRSLATKEAYFSDGFAIPGEDWLEVKTLLQNELEPSVIYIKGTDVQERLIQLLLHDRVDTIFEGNAAVDYLIGEEAAAIRKAGCFEFEFKENVIVSRYLTVADELLEVFNKKLSLFRQDGTMQRLKSRYHLD